jgi:hypothetical protein
MQVRSQALTGQVYPLSHEPDDIILNQYSTTDYHRAQLIIESLEGYAGKDRFLPALAQYLKDVKHRATRSADFEASLERFYGKDLSAFFNAYVYGTASMNYSLSQAALNKKVAGPSGAAAYEQRVTVGFSGAGGLAKAGPFPPTTVRAYLVNGATQDFPVTAPGEISVCTTGPVSFLLVDPDFRSIDYDRIGNAFPAQVKFYVGDTNTGLIETGAAAYAWVGLLGGYKGDELMIGAGPSVGEKYKWDLTAGPVFGIGSSSPLQIDSAMEAAFSLTQSEFTERLGALYTYGQSLDLAQASVTWSPYINSDLGYRSKLYRQPLSLTEALSLTDLPFTGGVSGSALENSLTLSYADLAKLGLSLSLSEKARYAMDTQSWENEAGFSASYDFAVYRQVMASLGASASYSWGALSSFGAGNAVLGFEDTATANQPWGLSWGGFLGLPLGGHSDVRAFGLFSVTNVYAGIEYRGAAAFSQAGDFWAGNQQAIGLEIVPVIRGMADSLKDVGVGLGISFNLTDIINSPGDPVSYAPAIYLNVTDASLYASLFAY